MDNHTERPRFVLCSIAIVALLLAVPFSGAQNDTTAPGTQDEERLTIIDGQATGRYVSFQAGAQGVCDWSYQGREVLDIHWDGFSGGLDHAGSVAVLRGDVTGSGPGDAPDMGAGEGTSDSNATADGNGTSDGDTTSDGTTGGDATDAACGPVDNATSAGHSRLILHDNPTGSIKAEPRGPSVLEYRFADDLSLERTDDRKISISGAGFEARIWKDQNSDEQPLEVDGQVVRFVSAERGNIMFRVIDADAPDDEAVADATADGRVAAELRIEDDEDIVVEPGEDEDVTIATSRERTRIDIDIDVTVDLTDDAPVADGGTGDGENGTGGSTENGTSDPAQNGTGDPSGNTDPNGTDATDATGDIVSVVVIDIDVAVLQADAPDAVVVVIDGRNMEVASSADDVLVFDGEESPRAFLAVDEDGELRVISNVVEGSQTVSLRAANGATFDAEPRPAHGDDADEVRPADGSDGDDDSTNDLEDVPSLPWLAAVAAIAGCACMIRRRY